MEVIIWELIKGNGVTGGLVIALFLFLKFNGFNHISQEHEEQKDLIIKTLEKQSRIIELLIEIKESVKK